MMGIFYVMHVGKRAPTFNEEYLSLYSKFDGGRIIRIERTQQASPAFQRRCRATQYARTPLLFHTIEAKCGGFCFNRRLIKFIRRFMQSHTFSLTLVWISCRRDTFWISQLIAVPIIRTKGTSRGPIFSGFLYVNPRPAAKKMSQLLDRRAYLKRYPEI